MIRHVKNLGIRPRYASHMVKNHRRDTNPGVGWVVHIGRITVLVITLGAPACKSWSEGEGGVFWKTGSVGGSSTSVFQVTAISPDNSSAVSSPNPSISITFSDAISAATLSTNVVPSSACSGSVQISSDDFTTCAMMTNTSGTLSNGDKTVTFTPVNMYGLRPFKLRATASIKSASGIALPQYTQSTSTYTTGFIYANQNASAALVQLTMNPLTGVVTANGTVATGTSPRGVVVSPDGRFVFAGVLGGPVGVYAYTVNANGTLSPVNNQPFNSMTSLEGLIMHPSGKFFYALSTASDEIARVTFDSTTGALPILSAGDEFFSAPGTGPFKGSVTSDGAYLVVGHTTNHNVVSYPITQATGALGVGNAQTLATLPRQACVNSTGTYVFGSIGTANMVSVFAMSNGTLSSGTAYGVVASGYFGCALSADDKYYYTADNAASFVRYMTIAANGSMSNEMSVATGSSGANGISIDRSGRFLFVASSSGNTISIFSLNTTTGAPTLLSNPTAGTNPRYVIAY